MLARMDSQQDAMNKKLEDIKEHVDIGLRLNKDEMHETLRASNKALQAQIDDLKSISITHFDAVEFKKTLISEFGQYCSAHSSLPPAGGPLPPMAQQKANGNFIANRIFLKGFCNYGMDQQHGIRKEKGEIIAKTIISALPLETQFRIQKDARGYSAPFLKNRQIVIHLVEGIAQGEAYEIAQHINGVIESKQFNIDGRPIYAVSDTEQWKKDRNASVAKAEKAINTELEQVAGVSLFKDWPSGSLWTSVHNIDCKIGAWNRNNGWQWFMSEVHKVWPQALEETLNNSMSM